MFHSLENTHFPSCSQSQSQKLSFDSPNHRSSHNWVAVSHQQFARVAITDCSLALVSRFVYNHIWFVVEDWMQWVIETLQLFWFFVFCGYCYIDLFLVETLCSLALNRNGKLGFLFFISIIFLCTLKDVTLCFVFLPVELHSDIRKWFMK